MQTARLDIEPGSLVRFSSIEGDLRLTGCEQRRLEAQAGRRGGLRASARGQQAELTCSSGCLVFLPVDCRVEIGDVAGDVRITDLRGEVSVRSVGGDLRLRRLGTASIERVRGEVLAQRIERGLRLGRVGGQVRVEQVAGEIDLGSIGGDLVATGLAGRLQGSVDGDAAIAIDPPPGSEGLLRVGGNASIRVPPHASVVLDFKAAGTLALGTASAGGRGQQTARVTLGSGEATLEVVAGGDIAFSELAQIPPSDLAGAITAQVESALAEVEAELTASLGEGRVGEQVRRAVERALRPAGRPRSSEDDSADAGAGLERERRMILTMLAENRIKAEEAEALFRALEGRA